MIGNRSNVLAAIGLACVLVAARRAPVERPHQAIDACWFQAKPGELEK